MDVGIAIGKGGLETHPVSIEVSPLCTAYSELIDFVPVILSLSTSYRSS